MNYTPTTRLAYAKFKTFALKGAKHHEMSDNKATQQPKGNTNYHEKVTFML